MLVCFAWQFVSVAQSGVSPPKWYPMNGVMKPCARAGSADRASRMAARAVSVIDRTS